MDTHFEQTLLEWLRNGDEDVAAPFDAAHFVCLRRERIPEGWEPIAPGRAKHAPGE